MNQNNNNEFENLFKRAAEQYPLDTDTANWDAVLSKLEETEKKKPFFFFSKRTGITLSLILFVGFLSSLVTGILVWDEATKTFNKIKIEKNTSAQPNNTNSNSTTIHSQPEMNKTTQKKIADEVYDKVVNKLNTQQHSILLTAPNKNGAFKSNLTNIKSNNSRSTTKKIVNTQLLPSNLGNTQTTTAQTITSELIAVESTAAQLPKIESATNKVKPTSETIPQGQIHQQNNQLVEKTNSDTIQTTTSNNTPSKSNDKKNSTVGNKFFYAGLLYSKDRSTIGFEPNMGKGYSYQVLLGYRLNNKLSFETGIHIEKKELYTTNDTYYKEVINPAGTVVWIESESKLIELPFTVKYDLLNSKKHNFFASLGISSYITNSEHIEYEEKLNGLTVYEYLQLEKRSSDFFASTNFSLGYNFKMGKKFQIRVEPYINLPIKGIGKGSAPIVSRGIYMGLIYNFQKKSLKQ